jgi:hypothetical protein
MSDAVVKDEPAPAEAVDAVVPTKEEASAEATIKEEAPAEATTNGAEAAGKADDIPETTAKVIKDEDKKEVKTEAKAEEKAEEKGDAGEQQNNETANQSKKLLKTMGTINHKDYSKNRKFDPTSLPDSDDPVEIRTQVIHPSMALVAANSVPS